jgi:hypothetical protein
MSTGTFQGQRRWKKNWQGGQQRRNWQPRTYEPPPEEMAAAREVAPTPAAKPIVTGTADLWIALQVIRDPSAGASKVTRAMRVPGGVVVNVTTRGASYAAEALVMIPGADLIKVEGGHAIVGRASP